MENPPANHGGLSRRQMLAAAAVTTPAIVLTTAVPAHATSANSTLAVDIDATSITAGDYATVTATVRDHNGNPWAGQPIQLSTGTTTGVSLTSATGVTDSNGVFSTTLHTDVTSPIGGTITITASSGPKTATDTATVAAAVLTVAPTPTALHGNTIHVRAGEANTFIATLTNVSGRPISGANVTFGVTGFDATFGTYDAMNPIWVTTTTGATDSNGNFTAILTPEQALFGDTATLVASGPAAPDSRATSATNTLTATNTNVYAAGWNAGGQIGDGSTTTRTTLTATARVFPSPVIQVASGGSGLWSDDGYKSATNFATLFLLQDGTVWSVGSREFGMVGVSDPSNYFVVPKIVPGLSDVKQVAAGSQTSYALTHGGAVYSWGVNTYGERGTGSGTTGKTTTSPGLVASLASGIDQIAVGNRFAFALTSTGGVKAWGTDRANGNFRYGYPAPVDFDVSAITETITSIAASGTTGYALAGGKVYSWGQGSVGQLGNGTDSWWNITPQLVSGLSNITAIATSWSACYALTDVHGVKSWGSDTGYGGPNTATGLLGDNSAPGAKRNTPADVIGLTAGVRSIAGIGGTAFAIMQDGTMRAWGSDANGLFGNGSASSAAPSPVAAGSSLPAGKTIDALIDRSPFSLTTFVITSV